MKGLMIGSYQFLNSIKYFMLCVSVISFSLNLMFSNLLVNNVIQWFGVTLIFIYFRLLFEKVAFDDF